MNAFTVIVTQISGMLGSFRKICKNFSSVYPPYLSHVRNFSSTFFKRWHGSSAVERWSPSAESEIPQTAFLCFQSLFNEKKHLQTQVLQITDKGIRTRVLTLLSSLQEVASVVEYRSKKE